MKSVYLLSKDGEYFCPPDFGAAGTSTVKRSIVPHPEELEDFSALIRSNMVADTTRLQGYIFDGEGAEILISLMFHRGPGAYCTLLVENERSVVDAAGKISIESYKVLSGKLLFASASVQTGRIKILLLKD